MNTPHSFSHHSPPASPFSQIGFVIKYNTASLLDMELQNTLISELVFDKTELIKIQEDAT
jgi:hypothetical protein